MMLTRVRGLKESLGSSFLKRLTGETILQVGSQNWTRDRLVREAGCGNFAAARKLHRALAELPEGTKLNGHLIESLAEQHGVGETTIYVLLCVQEATGQHSKLWPQTWRTFVKHQREEAER